MKRKFKLKRIKKLNEKKGSQLSRSKWIGCYKVNIGYSKQMFEIAWQANDEACVIMPGPK